MATVTKSWTFDSDNEGLADGGLSSRVAASWLSSDGSPANGCLSFDNFDDYEDAEYARKSSTSDTWETWGVPAGATITNVQLTNIAAKRIGGYWVTVKVISSTGSEIATLVSTLVGGAGTWATSSGTLQSVGSSFQASTTSVRLELYALVDTYCRVAVDTIEVTITYTAGGGGSGASNQAESATERHFRGHANLRR